MNSPHSTKRSSCRIISNIKYLYLHFKSTSFIFSLQVTEGKQDLEKALSLSQKFQKESAALQEWLTTNEAQLQQKNSCGDMPADIDAEIAWANVSNLPNLLSHVFRGCKEVLLLPASRWCRETVIWKEDSYSIKKHWLNPYPPFKWRKGGQNYTDAFCHAIGTHPISEIPIQWKGLKILYDPTHCTMVLKLKQYEFKMSHKFIHKYE